jgi:hypothetical protein
MKLSRPFVKTLNVYWVSVTAVMVWFLFVHSPPYLWKRAHKDGSLDIPFALHLMGAYSISLACIVNALFTPSTLNGAAKPYHVWIGRFGMIAGIIAFLLGSYCSWWPWRRYLPERSFAIAITGGGVFQVWFQFVGYRAIRRYQTLKAQIEDLRTAKEQNGVPSSTNTELNSGGMLDALEEEKRKALSTHIGSMIALLVIGCGGPAFIRLVGEFGFSGLSSFGISVAILIAVTIFYSASFKVPEQEQASVGERTPLI